MKDTLRFLVAVGGLVGSLVFFQPPARTAPVVGLKFIHVVYIAWEGTVAPDVNLWGPRVIGNVRGWTRESYGKVTFDGRWYDPIYIPKPSGTRNYEIGSAAISAATIVGKARGDAWATIPSTDFSQFVAYQLPPIGNSFAMGRGWVSSGGGANMHEAGHTIFRFSHAHAYEWEIFRERAWAAGSFGALANIEYGYPRDVMGNGGEGGSVNVGFKRLVGWVDDGVSGPNTLTVTGSGTFTIVKSDVPLAPVLPVALRIPYGDPRIVSNVLNVEYRSGLVVVSKGAQWVADDFDGSAIRQYDLSPGKTYTDARSMVSITTVARTTADVTLTVQVSDPTVVPRPAGVAEMQKAK